MAWTNSQLRAIESRHGNYLVSAGAGSGKTAVLTERILRIIIQGEQERSANIPLSKREGAKVNELLVLTFTNKAAGEMKSRIRRTLFSAYRQGRLAEDVSSDVENGDITTFDAFFLSLVKRHHYELGLPEDIAIGQGPLLALCRTELLETIFEEHYAAKDPLFLELASYYATKDDEKLRLAVDRLEEFSKTLVNPEDFLLHLGENYADPAFKAKAREAWRLYGQRKVEALLEDIESIESSDAREAFTELALRLNEAARKEDGLSLFFADPKNKKGKTPNQLGLTTNEEKAEKGKNLCSAEDFARVFAIKTAYESLGETFSRFGSFDAFYEKLSEKKELMALLGRLSHELSERFLTYKKAHSLFEFADIARYARLLLADESIRKTLQKSYRYIMVDEYQDTSDLQEDFLSKIADENLFAVGDMKQSIYGFRNANPSIFLSKYARYEKGEGGTLIVLNANFRSSRNVIEDVNAFFGETMNPSFGGLSYDKNQALDFGNVARYGKKREEDYRSEVLLIPECIQGTPAEREAEAIALDILEKRGKLLIRKTNKPADFGDFTILSYAKTPFEAVARVFAKYKIPLSISQGKDLSNEDVALVFKSFLRLYLSYGHGDSFERHAYASIKRSYLFGDGDEVLFPRLLDGSYRKDPFYQEFGQYRKTLEKLPLSKAVQDLLDHYGFYTRLLSLGEVESNYEKLASFLDFAVTGERMELSFEAFAKDFLLMEKKKITPQVDLPTDSSGAVRLMSIHASKGLEFPVVYLLRGGASLFRNKDRASSFLFSKDYGVLMPLDYFKPDGSLLLTNPLSELLLAERDQEGLNEQMRILYVALTRAEQRFSIVESENATCVNVPLSHGFTRLKWEKGKEGEEETKKLVPDKAYHAFSSYRDFFALGEKTFGSWARHTPKRLDPSLLATETSTEETEERGSLSLRSIDSYATPLPKSRASKKEVGPLPYEKLAYGTRMHRLLELVSFKAKDLSFLRENKDKERIARVLALPFFQEIGPFEEYHEYHFFDEENNLEGSIDLLLLAKERAYIIDYKARETEDPAYLRQLGAYKRYVEKAFGLKASTYLLSVAEASLEELKTETPEGAKENTHE